MGNSNVNIYYELNKPFYYAGEWVQGNVFLVVKAPETYSALLLKIEGYEFCRWPGQVQGTTFQGQKVTLNQLNIGRMDTYKDEHVLAKFDGGLQVGHYIYPFSFQLPADMPGSYFQKKNKLFQIRYPLTAHLVDIYNDRKKDKYCYNLTVIEPPRVAQQNVILRDYANPQQCCCIGAGHTEMSVKFRSTANRSDLPLWMDIQINNRECSQDIKYVDLRLFKNLFAQQISGRHAQFRAMKCEIRTRSVKAGQVDVIQVAMPTPVHSSTAIGTILANFYTLEATGKVSGLIWCCGHNHPFIQKEIYIEQANPDCDKKQKMTPPVGWNPIVAPATVITNSKQFNFKQNPFIGAMNR